MEDVSYLATSVISKGSYKDLGKERHVTIFIDNSTKFEIPYFEGEKTIDFMERVKDTLKFSGIYIDPYDCYVEEEYSTDSFLEKNFGDIEFSNLYTNGMVPIDKHIQTSCHSILTQDPAYEFAYAMSVGLRMSVENSHSHEDLSDKLRSCCRVCPGHKFPPEGSAMTPPHNCRPFFFKSYAPDVFASIRRKFHISPPNFIESICPPYIGDLDIKSDSESRKLYYFTDDKQYIVKSITPHQKETMLRHLEEYYMHISAYPMTFLVRCYGMYEINFMLHQKQILLVMGSITFTASSLNLQRMYNIKGSTQSHHKIESERKLGEIFHEGDFIQHGVKLKLDRKKKLVIEQLEHDIELLRCFGVMNYSILLGIHYDHEPEMKMKGFLKRRTQHHPWTQCLFEIEGGNLTYSKKNVSAKIPIPLDGITVLNGPANQPSEFLLKFTSKAPTIHLQAENEEMKEMWIIALKHVQNNHDKITSKGNKKKKKS